MGDIDKKRYPYLGKSVKLPIEETFEPIEGIPCVLQDIEQGIMTSPGERVRRTNTGGGMNRILWENQAYVESTGKRLIAKELENEPRIIFLGVVTRYDADNDTVIFVAQFLMKDTSERINLVLPYYQSNRIRK